MLLRQGDVLIVPVKEIPSGVTEVARENDNVVLAHGEVTGHSHRIPSRAAKLFKTESDQRFMRVTAPVALLHEEHTKVTIPPGSYKIRIHKEYAPGELAREVQD